MIEISKRIKERRVALGMTKTDIALYVGCSVTMVSKWEDGVGIGLHYAAKLAEKLEVSLSWLHYGGDEINSNSIQRKIPIVGTTQAGPNKEWEELGYVSEGLDEYIDFPTTRKSIYALKVSGESMSPRILPGEAVLVDPDRTVTIGEQVIVRLKDGSVMVKTLAMTQPSTFVLDSYNQGYQRIIVERDEINLIHPVVAVVRSNLIKQRV